MSPNENPLRERKHTEDYQAARSEGKLKWQKSRNKMTHLRPKKKKRK